MSLKIELLSDLCVSAGETYNSYVDIDVVYDDYGLPYIPAKRVKGCIREAALELVEWGVYDEKVFVSLFGKEGKEKSLFSLDNAHLEEYPKYVADLAGCGDKVLVHPQRVLGLYTYTRTQTAMNTDGVADKGSLRTSRVLNKGLVFEASLKENIRLTAEQKSLLQDAVSMVKHMGTGRTRGLGLVHLSLSEPESVPVQKQDVAWEYGERNRIDYRISLKSSLLCKSAEGSQEKTQDYIEGSKMIGVLAQNLPHDKFVELMRYDGSGTSILVSNAYICKEDERYTPARASLQKVKDATYDAEGKMPVADMLVEQSYDVQWTPVGHAYVSAKHEVAAVDVETTYHHRRPEDKSVGKATGEDGSAFYQLESIRRDQQFAGYILADKNQAKLIVETINRLDGVRMGYGRNAEYGNVEVSVTKVEPVLKAEDCMSDSFVVKLNSAAILYNEYGVPCAEAEVLKNYVADALETEAAKLEIVNAFLTYETIGGYNVTWNRRKPIFTALGKGTVCYIRATEPVNLSGIANCFIGERTAEGYGEVEVSGAPKKEVVLCKGNVGSSCETEEQSDILVKLRKARTQETVSNAGVLGADRLIASKKNLLTSSEIDAAFSKLRIIIRAEKTLDDIMKQVDGIESDEKRKLCKTLLKPVSDFLKEYGTPEGTPDKEEIAQIYLYSFMNQIKYKRYKQKKGGGK